MRTFLIFLIPLLFVTPVLADTPLEPLMNKVTLQFDAEQWVVSKSALVTVGINAAVSDIGLEKIQSQVLTKLNQLSAKGEWHLVSFYRSLDKSGLETIQISAQARLPEPDLVGLRDKAKAISKPGETYTIDNIQFTPTEDEVRAANSNLRDKIYAQTKTEIDRLNKMYPEQKYYVHDINFITNIYQGASAGVMYKSVNEVEGGAPAPAARPALPVGDKLRLSATVVLATSPDPDIAKILHN